MCTFAQTIVKGGSNCVFTLIMPYPLVRRLLADGPSDLQTALLQLKSCKSTLASPVSTFSLGHGRQCDCSGRDYSILIAASSLQPLRLTFTDPLLAI